MAESLVTLTGISITHDETAGTQSSGVAVTESGLIVEDNNDSDVSVAVTDIPFDERLFGATSSGGLGLDPASILGIARSSGDVVTINSTTVVDVAFTDANGAPLNGAASGLFTNAGNQIFLYTDTENNIVLAREGSGNTASASGDVVFAVIIDETATGARFWIVQFEALAHNTDGAATDGATALLAGAHDDALDLTDKLFVEVEAPTVFSDLSKAPSGQNDWLGFGPTNSTADIQILTTGLAPLEASNNQEGDTVNTSTIGLGSNSQSIGLGDGIRVDIVSGLNLPPQGGGTGDTKDIFGISYTDHVDVPGAGFQLVQVNGSPNNTVDVKLTVLNTADEEGQDFVDPGLGNDASVPLGFVQVLDAAGNIVEESDGSPNAAGVGITINGNTATITGLLEGYQVAFTTSGGALFNRFTVENVTANAKSNDSFDLGNIVITQGDSDVDEVGSKVRFEDDGPSAAITQSTATVSHDETAGVQGDANDTTAAAVAALFAGVSNVSTDLSAAGFAQSTAAVVTSTGGTAGTDGGSAATFSLAVSSSGVDSGIDTTDGSSIFLFLENGIAVGRIGGAAGAAAFAVAIDSTTGVVSTAQYASLKQPTTTNHDEAVSITDGALLAVTTVTDAEGDVDTAAVGIGDAVLFQDDGPANGPDDGFVDFASGASDTQPLDEVPGEDGFGSHQITAYTDHPDLAEKLSNNDSVLTYYDDANTNNIVDAGEAVFRLTLNTDDTYTFEVLKNAPPVEVPLNFAAIPSGSPQETLSVPAVGTGVNIVFDGVIFSGAYPNFTDLNAGADDDLNPDNVGFGVKQGQASQHNQNEGWFAVARDATTGDPVDLFGLSFDIQGIGSVSKVNVEYTIVRGQTATSTIESVDLPKGNNTVPFEIDETQAFDAVFVRIFFDTADLTKGVRLLNFSTTLAGEFPDQTLEFTAQVTDGDGDTASNPFEVDIDGNHDGLITV